MATSPKKPTKKINWDDTLDRFSSIANKVEYAIDILRYMARCVSDFPRYRDYRDRKADEQASGDQSEASDREVQTVPAMDSGASTLSD